MRQNLPIDSDLVINVQQGDKFAEDQIYRKYSDRLYFLALSELHSHEDAEDVRSETFIRVIQAVRQGKLRKPESLGSFMVGIALNVIRELRRQRFGVESLEDNDVSFAGEASPEKAFLDQEVSSFFVGGSSRGMTLRDHFCCQPLRYLVWVSATILRTSKKSVATCWQPQRRFGRCQKCKQDLQQEDLRRRGSSNLFLLEGQ